MFLSTWMFSGTLSEVKKMKYQYKLSAKKGRSSESIVCIHVHDFERLQKKNKGISRIICKTYKHKQLHGLLIICLYVFNAEAVN